MLVATDDLNLAMLLVCRIKSEEPHDVQHLCRLHHLGEGAMNIFNSTFCFDFAFKPRSPFGERSSDAAIAEGLTLGGKVEDVWNKHLRDALLIAENVIGSISPCNTAAYRALDFAKHQRDTIDK